MATLTDHDATELFRRAPDELIDVGAGHAAHRQVGTGPDVLFVHGWPVSGATFRRLLPHLLEHVTCHVIDLPGAGSSRFDDGTTITVDQHIESVRRVVEHLGLERFAVVGHDSGGLIARHALAGDGRVRAWGLIDTEQTEGLSRKFKQFLASRRLPGFEWSFGRLVGARRARRSPLVFGGAFTDPSLLDGDFDELFLQPIHRDPAHRRAAVELLDSFDERYVHQLRDLHTRIDEPVVLVWGEDDPFFPLRWAEAMVDTFADAHLEVIPGTKLFPHEEKPADVATALLATIAAPERTP